MSRAKCSVWTAGYSGRRARLLQAPAVDRAPWAQEGAHVLPAYDNVARDRRAAVRWTKRETVTGSNKKGKFG